MEDVRKVVIELKGPVEKNQNRDFVERTENKI